MNQALPCPLPSRLAHGPAPLPSLSHARVPRARHRVPRGQEPAREVERVESAAGSAQACPDPSLGQRARPLDIWDLRVLLSYLASADQALTTVAYAAADEIPGGSRVEAKVDVVRKYVREAAAEIESLSAIVQRAAANGERFEARRGRR
jgi:hypothetical protein